MLLQLLLALQLFILQLVTAILQRLLAFLAQQHLLGQLGRTTPARQPAEADRQHGASQQQGPEPGLDHLRLR